MDWTFVARFTKSADERWLFDYVPGNRHRFHIVPNQGLELNWHQKRTGITQLDEWVDIWQQSSQAFAQGGGVITAFPQLAATSGLQQRLARKPLPVVAWCFNLGVCYSGVKGWLAQQAFKDINRFVVHSRREQKSYSEWLQLPLERFEFVPYQIPEIPIVAEEETHEPFILAMGSAQRDYQLFFEVMEQLGWRTIVVAGQHALEGLTIPKNVEIRNGITLSDCYRLAQQARINVVPLLDKDIATGPSTIVATLRMGKSVVATRTTGSEDYVVDGETGFLTTPDSVAEMRDRIEHLWWDDTLRQRLGANAAHYASEHFSDEAAGMALGRILDKVAEEVGQF